MSHTNLKYSGYFSEKNDCAIYYHLIYIKYEKWNVSVCILLYISSGLRIRINLLHNTDLVEYSNSTIQMLNSHMASG